MGVVLFHVAFPMKNVEATKRFYVEGLGCVLGRESKNALTLNLGGHQIVAQMTTGSVEKPHSIYPRHFGLVFTSKDEWQTMVDRAKDKKLSFYQEPRTRLPDLRWNTTPSFWKTRLTTCWSSRITPMNRRYLESGDLVMWAMRTHRDND